jgi:hypothetical protein
MHPARGCRASLTLGLAVIASEAKQSRSGLRQVRICFGLMRLSMPASRGADRLPMLCRRHRFGGGGTQTLW